MNKIIPIVLISDEKFVLPTAVMLKSLFENKNVQTYYKIFILTDNMEAQSIRFLNNMNKENFDVEVVVASNVLRNINSINKVVSNTAYLKFSIANIFQDFDKILYIDTDTIILKDLSELYGIDIKDTYAGVVLDYCVTQYENRQNLFNLNQYFNSGMMLLNCKKIRKENLVEQLQNWIIHNNKKYRFKDQDAFNVCFNDNITVVEPKYNFFSTLAFYKKREYLKFYGITENSIDTTELIIIHYAWKKPWKYKKIPYSEYWYKYYHKQNLYNPLNLKSCIIAQIYVCIRNRIKLVRMIERFIKIKKRKTI